MSRLSYERTMALLDARGIMPERPPSLEPTREGLRRLGFAEWAPDPSKVVVVAGTNGKGSVCAALEAILLAKNERVGLYTSPHLIDCTERIRVDGRDVSRELFCDAYAVVAEATAGLPLTQFEVLTLMAIWIFSSGRAGAPCDRVILEVGLGGVWDSTNAVPHANAVITTLGLDHQNLLGATLPEIARNKLGIVARDGLVVHAPFPEETRGLVDETRARLGGRWVERMAFESRVDVDERAGAPRWLLALAGREGVIQLAGRRGAENAALAATVARELGATTDEQLAGLARARWPGRMELAGHTVAGAPVYLSGDHNPQGIASLLELLPHYPRRALHLVVGVGVDKDLDGVLAPLFTLPDARVYLTETPFRGRKISEYGKWSKWAVHTSAEPASALAAAQSAAACNDLVLVTGSLYLVGVLRACVVAGRADENQAPARAESPHL